MIKIMLSIAFAIVTVSSFSLNSFAANAVNNPQKTVTHVDNDTAGIDSKQAVSEDSREQAEKQVKTRPRRRR